MDNNFGKDIAFAQMGGKTYITPVSAKGHFYMQNTTQQAGKEADRYIGTDTYVFFSHLKAMSLVELAQAKGLQAIER